MKLIFIFARTALILMNFRNLAGYLEMPLSTYITTMIKTYGNKALEQLISRRLRSLLTMIFSQKLTT
jgi:hypothetical protein